MKNLYLPKGFRPVAEQKKVFDLLNDTSSSMFLSGRAGTGKTSLIEYFRSRTKKNYLVLTHTGLAAVLARGRTIHSFFRLPHGLLLKGDREIKKISSLSAILENLDMIIIDEISTVRCDLLNAIDESIRKYRNPELPFGGIQMVFVGDIYQIPPVAPNTQSERDAFEQQYDGIWFFYNDAFRELENNIEFIELKTNHRQKDEILRNRLRDILEGNVSPELLAYFNSRKIDNNNNIVPPSSAIALCPTNLLVNEYNDRYLSKLKGEEFSFYAEHKNFMANEMPTEEKLILKENARVMMLNNDSEGRWVNGTFATIRILKKDSIFITVSGPRGENGPYEVQKHTWDKYKYPFINGKPTRKNDGFFTQFPVRLARAITIHKSQGQTFENVYLDMGRGSFTHGQSYVALSRVKELNGLYLKEPIKKEDIIFDDAIYDFTRKHSLI